MRKRLNRSRQRGRKGRLGLAAGLLAATLCTVWPTGPAAPAETAVRLAWEQPARDALTPAYPADLGCGRISSLFGDPTDLDGSPRPEPHEGIDLGDFGDLVIAPADGLVRAVWRVEHDWGDDWNLLLVHSPGDLSLPDSGLVYFTEFDHLQRRDLGRLEAGSRLRRGDRIGRVRHPGNDPRFRAELHVEVYEVPAARQDELSWRTDLGFRYWLLPSARLVDPLAMMALHQEEVLAGRVQVVPFWPGTDYRGFKGLTYPLACPPQY